MPMVPGSPDRPRRGRGVFTWVVQRGVRELDSLDRRMLEELARDADDPTVDVLAAREELVDRTRGIGTASSTRRSSVKITMMTAV